MSFIRLEPGKLAAQQDRAVGVFTLLSPHVPRLPVTTVPRDTETIEDRKVGPVRFPLPDLDDYYAALRGLEVIFEQLRLDHSVAVHYGHNVLSAWEIRAYGAVAHSDHLRQLLPRLGASISTRKRLSIERIFHSIDAKCRSIGLEIHMAKCTEEVEPYFANSRKVEDLPPQGQ